METKKRSRARQKIGWHAVLCGLVLVAGGIFARPAGQQPLPRVNQPSQNPFQGFDDPDPAMATRRMRALNVERQQSMVSDTEKLLRLARELNQEVESSNPSALTPVQLRKLADIEKLARNVKQKMSISFTGAPTFQEPLRPEMP